MMNAEYARILFHLKPTFPTAMTLAPGERHPAATIFATQFPGTRQHKPVRERGLEGVFSPEIID